MARILIIDDEAQIRKMLSLMIADAGHEVEVASNGGIGLELQIAQPFDLVITDLVMPEKEGLETIREFKENFPGVRIIAISGGGQSDPGLYLKMARASGAARTFSKPLKRRILLESVRSLLEETEFKPD